MSELTPVAAASREPAQRLAALAREYAITVAVAVVVFLVAYDNGGFAESTRGILGIAVWWVIFLVVAFGFAPRVRVSDRGARDRRAPGGVLRPDPVVRLLGGGRGGRLSRVRAGRAVSRRVLPRGHRLNEEERRPLGGRIGARAGGRDDRLPDQPFLPGLVPCPRSPGAPAGGCDASRLSGRVLERPGDPPRAGDTAAPADCCARRQPVRSRVGARPGACDRRRHLPGVLANRRRRGSHRPVGVPALHVAAVERDGRPRRVRGQLCRSHPGAPQPRRARRTGRWAPPRRPARERARR